MMRTTQSSIPTHGRDALPCVHGVSQLLFQMDKGPEKGSEEEIEQKIKGKKISEVGEASRFAFRLAQANRDGSPTRAGTPVSQ